MSSFASTVVSLLVREYGVGNIADASPKAQQLASALMDIISDAEKGTLDVTKDDILGLDEDESDPTWLLPDDRFDDEDLLTTPGRTEGYRFGNRFVDKDTVEEAYNFYRSADKGFRSVTTMGNRYRWISSQDHLRKMREIVEKVESRRQKISSLKEDLLEWVLQKFESSNVLHDTDLRFQALLFNREKYQIAGFKASNKFLLRFKKENMIVSRKITKFVSKKNFVDQKKIDEAGQKFVQEVKDFMKKEKIPLDAVFNADQSGFVKEMYGARSLALHGQRSVLRVVGSTSAVTHSSTILPQVSASGSLREKICIVLQEPGGKLPAKGHFQADNLVVFAHSSHIMTKQLMIQWLKDAVFTADLPTRSLLILDSWPAFRDHGEIQKHVPKGKKVFIMNIPPGCTAKVQPLDVFFFIHVKRFMKRISAHVQLQAIDFVVHKRDNLLKSLSQVFRIFAHKRFSGFLRYSWSAAGFTDHPGPFETPAEYAFNIDPDCESIGCVGISFVRCPYCEKCLCFSCFLVQFHRC